MSVLRHAFLSATILTSAVLAPAVAHAQRAGGEKQAVEFHIPSQDLGEALNELGRQAGISVAFPVEVVAGRRSPALNGVFVPAEAARRLAVETGLRVTELRSGSLLLVRPGQDSRADAEEAAGDSIVVTGFRQSLATARAVSRNADALVDVAAADDVGKLPDSNIAEALRRLPSVYLIRDQGEGRYVSIRGVDPVLNNVTMNGLTIAVSDTDGESGRAAPLDVLSAGTLSRIEVHKVTLPDMDAQGIGGTINIVTPSGYDHKGRYINARAEVGYNDFGTGSGIHAANLAYSDQFGSNDQLAIYLRVRLENQG